MPLFKRKRNRVDQPHQSSNVTVDFAQQAKQLIPAHVRMISGCHSEQTSADVSSVKDCTIGKLPKPAGRSGGACTSALLGLLYEKQDQKLTLQQVLLNLRKSLGKSGFNQIPQLTSSRPLEMRDTPYSLVGGSGDRRALLVGINYAGQSGQLKGCINDVMNMKKYIMEQQGYLEQNILVLVDNEGHQHPTREAIIRSLQQLVAQSVSGDSVYFHYSGHGGLLSPEWNIFKKNNNTKEYDETLYPVDHEQNGQIRDFSLFNHFVKPMAEGVTVTCVMDCCHSGSVLDLPYTYKPTSAGQIRVQHSMDSLSNLAFLYVLAGGLLPEGFEDITNNIEDVTGGDIDHYYGMAIEEIANDASTADVSGYIVQQDIESNSAHQDTESRNVNNNDENTLFTYNTRGREQDDAYTMYESGDRGSSNSSSSSSDDDDAADCGCVIDIFSALLEE